MVVPIRNSAFRTDLSHAMPCQQQLCQGEGKALLDKIKLRPIARARTAAGAGSTDLGLRFKQRHQRCRLQLVAELVEVLQLEQVRHLEPELGQEQERELGQGDPEEEPNQKQCT